MTNGTDQRHLRAYLEDDGALRIDGQDLGPGTAPVSTDGEYEWIQTVRSEDVARLVELLGGGANGDVLDLLAERYSGDQSYELERVLRELRNSGFPVGLFVWSG